jgi:hypothetical protein
MLHVIIRRERHAVDESGTRAGLAGRSLGRESFRRPAARLTAVAVTIAAALLVSGSTTLGLAGSATAAVDALVVGKVVDCGGRPPGRCFPQDRAEISAFNSRHQLVVKESITNGHYSLLLRPGRYTVIASTSDSRQARRSVLAKAHTTVHASLVFHIH